MLLAVIDEYHAGTYDFFYLPIDFKVIELLAFFFNLKLMHSIRILASICILAAPNILFHIRRTSVMLVMHS